MSYGHGLNLVAMLENKLEIMEDIARSVSDEAIPQHPGLGREIARNEVTKQPTFLRYAMVLGGCFALLAISNIFKRILSAPLQRVLQSRVLWSQMLYFRNITPMPCISLCRSVSAASVFHTTRHGLSLRFNVFGSV